MADDIVIRLENLARFLERNFLADSGDVLDAAAEIKQLRDERDAERALADELACALLDGPFHSDRRNRMYSFGWPDVREALNAWKEARRG